MKILVAVKHVIDYRANVRVNSDQLSIDTVNTKMSINPFDEVAVEEALRLKACGIVSDVVVVTLGGIAAKEVLQHALAMGADRGIHVLSDDMLEPIHCASVLKAVIQQEQPKIMLLGKQAIDDDCNQTGQILAGLLNWPQGTFCISMAVEEDICTVTRVVDQGLETLQIKLPAVVTTELNMNQPRQITLPNIMKAQKKPIEQIDISELNVTLKPHSQRVKVEAAAVNKPGLKAKNLNDVILAIEKHLED